MPTHDGGKPSTRDVRNYSPPKGPTNINDAASPGLKGTNWGKNGTQGPPAPKEAEVGKAGIGATNYGCCGSQGKH